MREVFIHTLVVSGPEGPCVIVIRPVDETMTNGVLRIVPIWIGAVEAKQLGAALEGVKFERPMTHDLMLDALTNLDAVVDHVLINDVAGVTFFARLFLRQQGRLVELDARPTDALALAVRQHAKIYIDDDVLERASYPFVIREAQSEEEQLRAFHDFVDELSPEDFLSE